MHAYFNSHVPVSDPTAVDALKRARIEPASLLGSRTFLGAASRLEALGIDPIIDSNTRADLRWGDVGRLYLFARESDVRKRRFQSLVALADSR